MGTILASNFLLELGKGNIPLHTSSYKLMLCTSNLVFDSVNHKLYQDVASYEITGGGYPTGGLNLPLLDYSIVNGNLVVKFGIASYSATEDKTFGNAIVYLQSSGILVVCFTFPPNTIIQTGQIAKFKDTKITISQANE